MSAPHIVECDSCGGTCREAQQFPDVNDEGCGACDGTGLTVERDDDEGDFDLGGEAGTE